MAVPKKKRSQIKTKSRRAIFRHKKFVKRHLEQTSYNNYVLPYREPGLIRWNMEYEARCFNCNHSCFKAEICSICYTDRFYIPGFRKIHEYYNKKERTFNAYYDYFVWLSETFLSDDQS